MKTNWLKTGLLAAGLGMLAAGTAYSATWSGEGPGTVTVSDGSTSSAPQLQYYLKNTSVYSTKSWNFHTVADTSGTVELPYFYTGHHAWYKVRVFLKAYVIHDGVTDTTTIFSLGPVNCCQAPSGGFTESGTVTFDVQAGDTYGFRFGGSNYDNNPKLSGTFAISANEPPANEPPVADAGPDQAVIQLGSAVQLDGSQSWDEEGDTLTYSWQFISTPEGSTAVLADSDTVNPTFTVDVYGDYVISLTVSDGSASATDEMIVSLNNVAPVANAGSNQSAVQGDTVCFDGTGSSDANLDTLTYLWSLAAPEGSSAVLNDPTSAQPCITTDLAGAYQVTLTVNDGQFDSAPSTADVAVVSYLDAFNGIMADILTAINEISLDVLKNKNMQNALTNKINEVVLLADQSGSYAEARDKLQNDILNKTDGCATAGEPDKNDWIQDCPSQEAVYPLVLEAIEYLESMM